MAENTRVSDAEILRREQYIRAGLREREIVDPFTWSYPWKVSTLSDDSHSEICTEHATGVSTAEREQSVLIVGGGSDDRGRSRCYVSDEQVEQEALLLRWVRLG